MSLCSFCVTQLLVGVRPACSVVDIPRHFIDESVLSLCPLLSVSESFVLSAGTPRPLSPLSAGAPLVNNLT